MGFKDGLITANDVKELKTTSDNKNYAVAAKSQLKFSGKGVNLRAGETKIVVQLERSKPVPLVGVVLRVPRKQQNKLRAVKSTCQGW